MGSGLGVAVNIAGIVSAFAVCLACNNASTRVLFAMGRDDVLPGGLGRTHRAFRTPSRAINLVGFSALALSLLVGLAVGPYPGGYADIGQFGTIPILILYILACLSLIVYMRRLRAAGQVRYSVLKHLVAPVIGIIIVFLPIYGSIWPWPPWPLNLITILIFVFLAVGIVIGLALRRRPDHLGDRIAFLLATGGDGDAESLEGEGPAATTATGRT